MSIRACPRSMRCGPLRRRPTRQPVAGRGRAARHPFGGQPPDPRARSGTRRRRCSGGSAAASRRTRRAELEAALSDAFAPHRAGSERRRGAATGRKSHRQRRAVLRRALAGAAAGAVPCRQPGDRPAPVCHQRAWPIRARRCRRRDPPWARRLAGPAGRPADGRSRVSGLQPGAARPAGRRSAAPADLRHHTLLHEDSDDDWREWLAAAGATEVDVGRGPRFDDSHLALAAAAAGQGVALADDALAAADSRTGGWCGCLRPRSGPTRPTGWSSARQRRRARRSQRSEPGCWPRRDGRGLSRGRR